MQQHADSSHEEFLFYKSNVHREDVRKASPKSAIPESLQNAFLSGQTLIETALNRLESSLSFGVILIRTDFAEKKNISIIDELCEKEQAIWGIAESDVIGCFFPDKPADACLRIAEILKKKLPMPYIGIASYPQANFTRDKIVENAGKALDHAMLSRQSDIVVFNAVSLNISGDKYYQQGNIHKAIEEFKTALLLEPSNVNIHNSLGVCYGSLGAYPSALEEFETAIQIAPDDMMAYYNAGLVTLMMEDQEEALRYFLDASRIGSHVFEAVFQTGKLYLKLGNPENAKEFLEKAVLLKPESVTGWRYLGECCMMLERIGDAIQAYKKAIKLNPSDAEALSALGYLFDIQGENPEIALAFCQHSVEISPENGLFRYRLGRIYLKQNRVKEASDAFRKASDAGIIIPPDEMIPAELRINNDILS